MEKIKAIENYENICFCCLKEKPIKTYSICGRGYGSSFDNDNTSLQLCKECTPEGIEDWFDEAPEIVNGFCEEYKYEDKIFEFVNTLPLQGQELFHNRLSSDGWGMDSQDWIDMKLDILPDKVYEDYGMYSPRQKKAYKERFPTCEHPVNKVYNDGSKGCWCPFGAHGEYGQKTGNNMSSECFNCKHYKVRETSIKEMDANTYKKYELYIKGMQYKHLFEDK